MQMIYDQPTISEIDKRIIEESFILGKLADENLILPTLGTEFGRAVSYSKHGQTGSVVFYVQSVSEEPYLLNSLLGKKSEDVFITFDNRIKLYLDHHNYQGVEDKVAFLREHFKNKIILFKPRLSYEHSKKRYHYNFDIVLVENEDEPSVHYVSVPQIKKGTSHKRFEKLLIEKKPIELEQHNHSLEISEFIVCDNYIYHIPDSDVFEKYKARKTTYICRKPEEIKRIPLPQDWHYSMAKAVYKDICFISTKTRMELTSQFDELGEEIFLSYSTTDSDANKGILPDKSVLSSSQNTSQEEKTGSFEKLETISEFDFLERLHALAEQRDLIYDHNDLTNLHISLKTSLFSILGGMSGTGKSELARLYADALGLKLDDNLLFLPVSPSFTEPSDILGFLNQQSGLYMESDTGLVSFLLKANREKDKMFMIVFDEMNLGQVEHYFSDFISILEAPIGSRKLKLFSDKSICRQEEYRQGIEIGDNVLFIGTANFDETTKDFSNRMLDRSNVIILEKKGFLEAKIYEEEQTSKTDDEIRPIDMSKSIDAANYNSWIKSANSLKSLRDNELKILDEIHEQISSFDSQTGVSFRIAKAIANYLANIPVDEDGNELLSREVSFDYQIKQRILPKIRGYRDQIETLVLKVDGEGKIQKGTIGLFLSQSGDFVYENSLKYLDQKAKELIRNGYTL
jgi:hypothetical protein